MRKWLLICLLLACPLSLSGCWDRKEINDVAFVLGSGVDKEGDRYRVTLQIALPGNLGGSGSKGGGGGTGGDKPYYLVSKLGITLRNATLKIQAGNSRSLSFAHRRILLIGNEFAKGGIGPMIDQFARIPQHRLSSLVAITEGPSYDLLGSEAPMEQFPSEMVRELITEYTKKPETLKEMMNNLLSEGVDSSVPYLSHVQSIPGGGKQSQGSVQISGIAVLRDDKFAGTLLGSEARIINMAMNQAPHPEFIIDSPTGKGHLSIKFTENTAEIIPEIHGDDITMHIRIYAKGSIIENETEYSLSSDRSMEAITREASKELTNQIQSAMRKLQHQYESDILGFGRTIREKHPEVWVRIKDRWREVYPEVKVVVHTRLQIENVGAINKPFGRREGNIKND